MSGLKCIFHFLLMMILSVHLIRCQPRPNNQGPQNRAINRDSRGPGPGPGPVNGMGGPNRMSSYNTVGGPNGIGINGPNNRGQMSNGPFGQNNGPIHLGGPGDFRNGPIHPGGPGGLNNGPIHSGRPRDSPNGPLQQGSRMVPNNNGPVHPGGTGSLHNGPIHPGGPMDSPNGPLYQGGHNMIPNNGPIHPRPTGPLLGSKGPPALGPRGGPMPFPAPGSKGPGPVIRRRPNVGPNRRLNKHNNIGFNGDYQNYDSLDDSKQNYLPVGNDLSIESNGASDDDYFPHYLENDKIQVITHTQENPVNRNVESFDQPQVLDLNNNAPPLEKELYNELLKTENNKPQDNLRIEQIHHNSNGPEHASKEFHIINDIDSNHEIQDSYKNIIASRFSPVRHHEIEDFNKNTMASRFSPVSNHVIQDSSRNIDASRFSPVSNHEIQDSSRNIDASRFSPVSNHEFQDSNKNTDASRFSPVSNHEIQDSNKNTASRFSPEQGHDNKQLAEAAVDPYPHVRSDHETSKATANAVEYDNKANNDLHYHDYNIKEPYSGGMHYYDNYGSVNDIQSYSGKVSLSPEGHSEESSVDDNDEDSVVRSQISYSAKTQLNAEQQIQDKVHH